MVKGMAVSMAEMILDGKYGELLDLVRGKYNVWANFSTDLKTTGKIKIPSRDNANKY